MGRVVGRAGETDFLGERLMSSRQPANIPIALSTAHRQFDRWRSRQRNKRARLPKELWQKAEARSLKTEVRSLSSVLCGLGLKYYSLKKHLDETGADELVPAKTKPDFIELVPGAMTPGSVECTIEWADGSGATVRMYIMGAGLSELTSLAGVFRGGQA
jgi:hypothetical protein